MRKIAQIERKEVASQWTVTTELLFAVLALFTLLSPVKLVLAQTGVSGCGPLANHYGPLDYRTEREGLKLVEIAHFTPNIESLISGNSGAVGKELDYTLRASPNHHRALISLMNLGEKTRSPKPYGLTYDIDCYFERALRFRPDDSTARMIYATFLVKNKKVEEATIQLDTTAKAAGDNAFTHYNIGRIFFDMKNYDRALVQAHIAYGMGFGLPILRNQLISVGAWKEAGMPPSQSPSH